MFYCKSRMTNAAAHPLGGERKRRRRETTVRLGGSGQSKTVGNAKGPGEGAVIGLGGWCEAR